jgi:YVTN family beta-propeller protein
MGCSFQQPDKVGDLSRIRSSTPSERVPQAPPPAENRLLSSPKVLNGRTQDPGSEKITETNVYAKTAKTQVDKKRFAGIPERVYVPNVGDDTVDVIDPKTLRVVDHYAVGQMPHHVTPSWDMKELYVNNEASSSLTVIDPGSGEPKGVIQVPYPYNLYFTPDGKEAIVVVERLQTLQFRDPRTWRLLPPPAWTTWTFPPMAAISSPAASGAGS